MNTKPSKSVLFLLYLALATLVVGCIAAGLRSTLTNDDLRAIERMLVGTLP